MKVAFITYYFSPELTPRAFKWEDIINYLTKNHDISFDVIVPQKPGIRRLFKDTTRITIHETKNGLFLNQMRMKVGNISANKKGNTFHLLKIFPKLLIEKLYFPDISIEWVPFAIRKCAELKKEKKFDLVISNALPFTCHIIGYYFSKIEGLPLILEYGDPFGFNPFLGFNRCYKRLAKVIESRIINKARYIVVPTYESANGFINYHSMNEEKLRVIPTGYPQISKINEINNTGSHNNCFNIVYSGSFYAKGRNPKTFFESLVTLKQKYPFIFRRLKVHFYGNYSSISNLILFYQKKIGKDNFILNNPVDRKQMIHILSEADLLLNFGNESIYQMPSKLVDYQYVNKPILTIKPQGIPYCRYLRNEIVCENVQEEIIYLIKKIIIKGIDEVILYNSKTAQFAYEDFLIETVATKYWQLISKCIIH